MLQINKQIDTEAWPRSGHRVCQSKITNLTHLKMGIQPLSLTEPPAKALFLRAAFGTYPNLFWIEYRFDINGDFPQNIEGNRQQLGKP